MIKKSSQMREEIRSSMRGGNGDVALIHMLEKDEMAGKARLAARMLIPVGGSIGEHVHDPEAEIYLIVSGVAEINDNGTVHTLKAGDIVFTSTGEFHSVSNAGNETLEIIGVVIE